MPDHPQMSELADEHGMDLHYGRKEKPAEHVHEWALELEEAHGGQFYCAAHCTICHLEMPTDETNRRLNATERLSAVGASFAAEATAMAGAPTIAQNLLAYASALEKD